MNKIKFIVINDLFQHFIGTDIRFSKRIACKVDIVKDYTPAFQLADISFRFLGISVLRVIKVASDVNLAVKSVVQIIDIVAIKPLDKGNHACNN